MNTQYDFNEIRSHVESFSSPFEAQFVFSLNENELTFNDENDENPTHGQKSFLVKMNNEIDDNLKKEMKGLIQTYIGQLKVQNEVEVISFRVREGVNVRDKNQTRRRLMVHSFLVNHGESTSIMYMLSPLIRVFTEENVSVKGKSVFLYDEKYEICDKPALPALVFGEKRDGVFCYNLQKEGLQFRLARLENGLYILDSSTEDFQQSLFGVLGVS